MVLVTRATTAPPLAVALGSVAARLSGEKPEVVGAEDKVNRGVVQRLLEGATQAAPAIAVEPVAEAGEAGVRDQKRGRAVAQDEKVGKQQQAQVQEGQGEWQRAVRQKRAVRVMDTKETEPGERAGATKVEADRGHGTVQSARSRAVVMTTPVEDRPRMQQRNQHTQNCGHP